MSLHPADIEADVLAELLAADEVERSELDPRKQLQTAEDRLGWSHLEPASPDAHRMEEDHFLAYGDHLAEEHGVYRKALSRADLSKVDGETRRRLREAGRPADPASEAYREVASVVLKAYVRGYGMMLDRQRGEAVPTPAPSAGRGPKLSEAVDAWKAGSGARGSRKPSGRTLLEADYAVRRLTEWHGDVRLGDLSREMARDFRNALSTVPTRLPGELKRLPMRDLLKRELKAYPAQHAATVNKALNILAAIISHAEAAGSLDAVPNFRNPFGKGMKLDVDARAEEERQPFTKADLAAIFGTGVYCAGERPAGGGGEAAFWLPLLGLLSGARQGELAALRIADLAQDPESGIWHFDIGTAGGRSIKTASSRRKVPLHPELERIGLLRYRQGLLDAGAGLDAPLWPHVEADTVGRQNGPWSKWFNRYLRVKAGVADRTKVFHSFRHTFKDAARNSGLREDVHDALTGHAGAGGVGRSYGQGFGLPALAEQVARIEAPAVVRGLTWVAGGVVRPKRRRVLARGKNAPMARGGSYAARG